jgi:hypothetical protein
VIFWEQMIAFAAFAESGPLFKNLEWKTNTIYHKPNDPAKNSFPFGNNYRHKEFHYGTSREQLETLRKISFSYGKRAAGA